MVDFHPPFHQGTNKGAEKRAKIRRQSNRGGVAMEVRMGFSAFGRASSRHAACHGRFWRGGRFLPNGIALGQSGVVSDQRSTSFGNANVRVKLPRLQATRTGRGYFCFST